MHKLSYSVFGRIDFFSVEQHLLISLGGSLQYEWTVIAPELTMVYFTLYFLVLSMVLTGPSFFVAWAIKACKFEVVNLPTICHKLLSNWTDVIDYLLEYTLPQETRGVKKMVSNFHKSWRECHPSCK